MPSQAKRRPVAIVCACTSVFASRDDRKIAARHRPHGKVIAVEVFAHETRESVVHTGLRPAREHAVRSPNSIRRSDRTGSARQSGTIDHN